MKAPKTKTSKIRQALKPTAKTGKLLKLVGSGLETKTETIEYAPKSTKRGFQFHNELYDYLECDMIQIVYLENDMIMAIDENAKLKSDWIERINPEATRKFWAAQAIPEETLQIWNKVLNNLAHFALTQPDALDEWAFECCIIGHAFVCHTSMIY